MAAESKDGVTVAAIVSVGLTNTSNAVSRRRSRRRPGRINAILLTALRPSAMVNAVITATEAKTMTVAEWDGTATGRSGQRHIHRFGGRGVHGARAGLDYAGPAPR